MYEINKILYQKAPQKLMIEKIFLIKIVQKNKNKIIMKSNTIHNINILLRSESKKNIYKMYNIYK